MNRPKSVLYPDNLFITADCEKHGHECKPKDDDCKNTVPEKTCEDPEKKCCKDGKFHKNIRRVCSCSYDRYSCMNDGLLHAQS